MNWFSFALQGEVSAFKKGNFRSPKDYHLSSVRDSVDSEVSESSAYPSARSSVDLSSDSEQERTCQQSASHTGTNSVYSEDRTSTAAHSNISTEEFCEVTNSVDNNDKPDQNSGNAESLRGRNRSECDSAVTEGSVELAEEGRRLVESMEVDSTEDVTVKTRTVDGVVRNTGKIQRPSVCDSSTSVSEETCSVSSLEQSHVEQPGCSSDIHRAVASEFVSRG